MGANPVSNTPNPTNTTYGTDASKASMAQKMLLSAVDAQLGIGTFLTIDELCAMAEQQLRESDGQIRSMLADVEAKRTSAGALTNIVATLKGAKGKSPEEQQAAIGKALEIAESMGDQGVIDKLKSLQAETHMTMDIVGKPTTVPIKMSNDFIESRTEEFTDMANKQTSSVDISMIRVQALMQQRGQIITFVSNAMAAINEPIKNTLGNMRG